MHVSTNILFVSSGVKDMDISPWEGTSIIGCKSNLISLLFIKNDFPSTEKSVKS